MSNVKACSTISGFTAFENVRRKARSIGKKVEIRISAKSKRSMKFVEVLSSRYLLFHSQLDLHRKKINTESSIMASKYFGIR